LHAVEAAFSRRPKSDENVSLTSFQLNNREYSPVFRNEGSKHVVNPRFDTNFQAALAAARPAAVFLYLGGGLEVAQTITNGLRPFDFLRSDDATGRFDTSRELIPFDMFRAYCDWIISPMATVLNYFRNVTDLPLYQIILPPITPSETYIVSKFMVSQAKADLRTEFEKTGIAPVTLRSKIWRTMVESTRQLCDRHHVLVIEPPDAAIDDHGYLRSEYWGDGIHANAGYGMLLLERIIDLSQLHQRESR